MGKHRTRDNDKIHFFTSGNNKSSINNTCNTRKANNVRKVKIGSFRSIRPHRLVPYPSTSLSRSFNIHSVGKKYIGVRNLTVMRKYYKLIRRQTRKLEFVSEVRHALNNSASKQETIYLIMRLRKLLCKTWLYVKK